MNIIVFIVSNKHSYEWVDEVITVIRQSGIKYHVGTFETIIEGRYDDIMKVIHDVNEYLYRKDCKEWISNV